MTETPLRTVTLPGGEAIPVLGVGTWGLAERAETRAAEIAALQTAVDLGMTVIDTAEMYAGGEAEKLVAEALRGRRRETFLVSKVLPEHAAKGRTIAACDASLRRLKTDRLDLYLLHWREQVPLGETVAAFETLEREGKIRYWGVSNFDVEDMKDLVSMPVGTSSPVVTNQVLYNMTRRGIEYDLLPWCRARGVPIMAYSPLEQGRIARNRRVMAIADRLGATPAQVALAWVLRGDGVMAIPKASHVEHVRENRGAAAIALSPEYLAQIDAAFPHPRHKLPLAML